jgi:hypothetical protein
LTLLAHDQVAREFWFWNGFGSIVIDAIRSTQPIDVQPPQHLTIRKAEIGDAEAIALIEAEHWRHYAQPPTLMPSMPDAIYRHFLQPHWRWLVWIAKIWLVIYV